MLLQVMAETFIFALRDWHDNLPSDTLNAVQAVAHFARIVEHLPDSLDSADALLEANAHLICTEQLAFAGELAMEYFDLETQLADLGLGPLQSLVQLLRKCLLCVCSSAFMHVLLAVNALLCMLPPLLLALSPVPAGHVSCFALLICFICCIVLPEALPCA